MVRVMFVCHGNICRSPMAEFIFKKIVAEHGLADEFLIKSSATSSEEIINGVGNPVYPAAKAELAKHGIVPEGKIHKLMDYTCRPGDVADPWYVGHFDTTYRDIYEACEGLLESLK